MKWVKGIVINLLALCALPAFAQDSLNMSRVWQAPQFLLAEDVAVQGNYAYVINYQRLAAGDGYQQSDDTGGRGMCEFVRR